MYEAKIIADSVCAGHRLTTMQLTHPRIVHAEFNTHCAFARNASSSRAIPFAKMVQRVLDDPFVPKRFGINQAGMQAFKYLEGRDHDTAVEHWLDCRDEAIESARFLAQNLNVHKQIANRLLEPWMWITVCVTGDWPAWSNYFALRCHPDAEDNIQEQAYGAQLAYFNSRPQELEVGGWHLPYVPDGEQISARDLVYEDVVKIAVGRCARTSYLTQEGNHDPTADIGLHDRLKNHVPLHASPFEHVCQATGNDERHGKYVGWKSYRHMLPNEYVIDFVPNHPQLAGA